MIKNNPESQNHQNRTTLVRVAWRFNSHRQALHPKPRKTGKPMRRLAAGSVSPGGSSPRTPKPW